MKKIIINIGLLILIPFFIGLPMELLFEKPEIVQVVLVLFALFEFLIVIGRINRHDLFNKEAYGTFRSDKTTTEYQDYIRIQKTLFISGVGNIIVSYLYFLIMGA